MQFNKPEPDDNSFGLSSREYSLRKSRADVFCASYDDCGSTRRSYRLDWRVWLSYYRVLEWWLQFAEFAKGRSKSGSKDALALTERVEEASRDASVRESNDSEIDLLSRKDWFETREYHADLV